VKRRDFLAVAGAATGTALASRRAEAARPAATHGDDYAVLVDLTTCIGCRTCELACAEANGLPQPPEDLDLAATGPRTTSDTQFVAVSRYDTSKGEVFVRRQCMHCLAPACVSGCLTKAMTKAPTGPVVWDGDKCMGCRYCMLSCPFDMPKFEYHSANPRIQKCKLCFERLAQDELPACVDNCPVNAVTFGKRDELLQQARERIYKDPGTYVPHIYGEHEVGGTSWLYISPVPFEELGFRADLGTRPVPEASAGFLNSVPMAMVAVPALLVALRRATSREGDGDDPPGTATSPNRPLPPPPTGLES
jgi:Fe-S-cluster-containing dehydrogenase component